MTLPMGIPLVRMRVVVSVLFFFCLCSCAVYPSFFTFHPGNINFHIPLTPSFGTNALYSESHPGKEDWHPLRSSSPGLGYVFDGARCLHFALENTTNRTRVSIDFRIAITRCKNGVAIGENHIDDTLCSAKILEDRFSSEGPGYYEEATINMAAGGPVVVKMNSLFKGQDSLTPPDRRVGFPFTN